MTVEDLARRFEADRRHLHAVAFHLLGSAADADDAVQAAWLKASRSGFDGVDNVTGWLTTITARAAIDQLRARTRRAERPLADLDGGEPTTTAADEEVLLADSVSRALLVVMDRLAPAQRVAFVLHDVFGLPFETIADVLERSPQAAKKLASRARTRLQAQPTASPGRMAGHVEIVTAFLAASRTGDIATLVELLAPGVVRTVDRILVPGDVPGTVHGAAEVADETRRFAGRAQTGAVVLVDGAPGIAIAPGGHLQALLRIAIGPDSRIHAIDIAGETDRLRTAVLSLP